MSGSMRRSSQLYVTRSEYKSTWTALDLDEVGPFDGGLACRRHLLHNMYSSPQPMIGARAMDGDQPQTPIYAFYQRNNPMCQLDWRWRRAKDLARRDAWASPRLD